MMAGMMLFYRGGKSHKTQSRPLNLTFERIMLPPFFTLKHNAVTVPNPLPAP